MRNDMEKYNLRSCVWEITLACCFHCVYCGSRAGKAREGELTTEECLGVADQLIGMGCRRVSLIGGEVFMRRDWDSIARRLTDGGVRVAIITNGYLFDDALKAKLREANLESVAVSIDGPRHLHDRYRQPGSFDRAVNALRAVAEAGLPATVISTLNGENVQCLEELYEALIRYPVSAWQLQACSPMGNAARPDFDHRFDPWRVIDFVEARLEDSPFPIGIADNIGYFTPGENRLRGRIGRRFPGCGAGLSLIGIDSVGNVRGCEAMYDDRFIEGNLRQKTIREIWENPDGFAYNRRFDPSLLTGKCAECPEGPYCAGGCRSYNYFFHGRMYEHPACARTLPHFSTGRGAGTRR